MEDWIFVHHIQDVWKTADGMAKNKACTRHAGKIQSVDQRQTKANLIEPVATYR
jgi:hypothetical protein